MIEKEKSIESHKLHGIQLGKITVVELYIRVNKIPEKSSVPDKMDINLTAGHTEYNKDKKTISVVIKAEIGIDKDKEAEPTLSPVSLKVEILGHFCVDEEKFPIEYIKDWAVRNAPFILHPYLREHIYSLTLRCGLEPLILPLMEVPTLSKGKKQIESKNQT